MVADFPFQTTEQFRKLSSRDSEFVKKPIGFYYLFNVDVG